MNEVSNNTAGGHIGGRDVIVQTVYAYKKSPLREKIEQLKADCLFDPNFQKCISELSHLINPVDPNQQRDLKTKLNDANRHDEIEEAEELKEKFAKILVKNGLSEQAQTAYVHILCKIKLHYQSKVKPLIKQKVALSEIEKQVLEIVETIYDDLSGTILEYNHREIKGMLYYLTGNCHIDWS